MLFSDNFPSGLTLCFPLLYNQFAFPGLWCALSYCTDIILSSTLSRFLFNNGFNCVMAPLLPRLSSEITTSQRINCHNPLQPTVIIHSSQLPFTLCALFPTFKAEILLNYPESHCICSNVLNAATWLRSLVLDAKFRTHRETGHTPSLTHSFLMYPFSTPWKHQKTLRFFLCFQGVEKACIGNEWVKLDH